MGLSTILFNALGISMWEVIGVAIIILSIILFLFNFMFFKISFLGIVVGLILFFVPTWIIDAWEWLKGINPLILFVSIVILIAIILGIRGSKRKK